MMTTNSCPYGKIHPSALEKNAEYFMAHAYNLAIDAWNADDPKPGTELKTREDGSPLIPEDDPAINYTS